MYREHWAAITHRKSTLPFLLPFDIYINNNYKIIMIRFSWDAGKESENRKKHKVSFEEARTVFFDANAIRYYDPDHSEDEDRFIMLGMSASLKILVVCHCYREDDSIIRIISARKATKNEAEVYKGERE